MKSICGAPGNRLTRLSNIVVTVALALVTSAAAARAQSDDAKINPPKQSTEAPIYQTFFLTNIAQSNEFTEIQTDLRNMVTGVKIYGIPSQYAISIRATPEDMAIAQKLIAELDRPRKIYRLTYTISDIDGGKRTGAQTFSLIATSGDRTILKQGGRVPIVTGKFDADASAQNTQVQYMDVGINIDATADGLAEGVRLRSKVEQSSLSDEKSGAGPQDPMLHQTVLEGTTTLALGKPLVLGSIDMPGTTRRQEVAVVAELVK